MSWCKSMSESQATKAMGVERHQDGGEIHRYCAHVITKDPFVITKRHLHERGPAHPDPCAGSSALPAQRILEWKPEVLLKLRFVKMFN